MERKILCIVDTSAELRAAIRYACRLAKRQGFGVALLYVLEPANFQHWSAVQNLMREEARLEGENIVQKWALIVETLSGITAVPYIREGITQEALLALLEEESSLCHVVLAAADNPENPGVLVSTLIGKMAGTLRVPITVVPGKLSDTEIDEDAAWGE
jgi:hypothetical protein